MNTAPGPDERRARALLIRAIEGNRPAPAPAAPRPAAPTAPPARADWWDRLYEQGEEGSGEDARDTKPRPASPAWEDTEPDDETTPRAAPQRRAHHPVRLLQVEFAGLERRTRWLISSGAGAALGWGLHLEHLFSGWITNCGHDTTPGTGVILGIGLLSACSYAAYSTRRLWPPVAWACRIPAATALLALCLYAPGVTQ